jgi:hypothetical protein
MVPHRLCRNPKKRFDYLGRMLYTNPIIKWQVFLCMETPFHTECPCMLCIYETENRTKNKIRSIRSLRRSLLVATGIV